MNGSMSRSGGRLRSPGGGPRPARPTSRRYLLSPPRATSRWRSRVDSRSTSFPPLTSSAKRATCEARSSSRAPDHDFRKSKLTTTLSRRDSVKGTANGPPPIFAGAAEQRYGLRVSRKNPPDGVPGQRLLYGTSASGVWRRSASAGGRGRCLLRASARRATSVAFAVARSAGCGST